MQKIFEFKGKGRKDGASASDTAEFLIEALIGHLRNSIILADMHKSFSEEVAWLLRNMHRQFGNWEKFSAQLPEKLRGELQDLVDNFHGESLEHVSGLSMLVKNVFDRLVLGEDYMAGAWLGLIIYAASNADMRLKFHNDTGYDLNSVLKAVGLTKMIDEATGYTKDVMIKWCDWVTENLWGEEGLKPVKPDSWTTTTIRGKAKRE